MLTKSLGYVVFIFFPFRHFVFDFLVFLASENVLNDRAIKHVKGSILWGLYSSKNEEGAEKCASMAHYVAPFHSVSHEAFAKPESLVTPIAWTTGDSHSTWESKNVGLSKVTTFY